MKNKITTVVGACLSSLMVCSAANAIEITASSDAQALVDSLIIPNSGITIDNAYLDFGVISEGGEFEGGGEEPSIATFSDGDVNNDDVNNDAFQAGTFTNSSNVYGLPSEGGIILSTGDVNDYGDGPNTAGGFTTSFGTAATDAQNTLLRTDVTNQSQHYDPVELGFTFDVSEDVSTLSFIATFGSEEFPEFVNSEYIDGFGMFVNGVNVAGAQETGAQSGDNLLPININHPNFSAIEGTELNGVLAPNGIPLLRFDVPVVPGSTGNTFELIIADASDSSYDTTVYLSSFGNFDAENGESEFTPIMPSNPTNDEGEFVFDLPELIEDGETIWIDPDIATGYTYTTDGLFASVTAPSLASVPDPNGYQITFNDGSGEITIDLGAGEEFVFGKSIKEFTLEGIDISLMLDPDDSTAFVTGISFDDTSLTKATWVSQKAITTYVDVPEPPFTFAFMLFVVTGMLIKRKC